MTPIQYPVYRGLMLFNEAIRKARIRLGESQAAFAQRFGVKQGVLSRWESGAAIPTGAGRELIRRVLEELDEGAEDEVTAS